MSSVFLFGLVIFQILVMRYFGLIVLIIGFSCLLPGCQKEKLSKSECDNLKEGLLTNDTKLVFKGIGSLMTFYSERNLNDLASKITGRCNIPATVAFNCVKTNPPQSEIIFSFVQQGTNIQKRLDISYTPDNKMNILNVHD